MYRIESHRRHHMCIVSNEAKYEKKKQFIEIYRSNHYNFVLFDWTTIFNPIQNYYFHCFFYFQLRVRILFSWHYVFLFRWMEWNKTMVKLYELITTCINFLIICIKATQAQFNFSKFIPLSAVTLLCLNVSAYKTCIHRSLSYVFFYC